MQSEPRACVGGGLLPIVVPGSTAEVTPCTGRISVHLLVLVTCEYSTRNSTRRMYNDSLHVDKLLTLLAVLRVLYVRASTLAYVGLRWPNARVQNIVHGADFFAARATMFGMARLSCR